jgi:hypothetical protein
MLAFVGFLIGQLGAIVLQVARWVDNTRSWASYFRDRRHQGRHVADAVISIVVFVAWYTGILLQFAKFFPEPTRQWIEALPVTPGGPMVTGVIGFTLCFVTRWAGHKWFDVEENP